MANYSTMIFTFNASAEVGDYFEIEVEGAGPIVDIVETFVTRRYVANESSIQGTPTGDAYNLTAALIADYGLIGRYNIYQNNHTVVVESIILNQTFDETDVTTGGRVSVFITNYGDEVSPISFKSTEYIQSDINACNNAKLQVETSSLATEIDTGSGWVTNTDNPFFFEQTRGSSQYVKIKDDLGNEAGLIFTSPDVLNLATTNIETTTTPNGGKATITHTASSRLEIEYSLDGVTWQASNIFNNLTDGNYDLYVRDQLGCSFQTSFFISIFTPDLRPTKAFSYISDSMSIRYKHNQVWDNVDIFKTDANTLSCEEDVKTVHKGIQTFKQGVSVTTQLLSNYDSIEANVIRENGAKEPLEVIKRISFLNIQDKRDANVYKYSDTEVGVYFNSGNTYDYTTGAEIGTYELNGQLPNYGAVGNAIYIPMFGGWFLIKDIQQSDDYNALVLIVDYVYNGDNVIDVVSCEYNQKNFNVYEFVLDTNTFPNEDIQVEVLQSSALFGEFNYLSEELEIVDLLYGHKELIWYNTSDTWVFYSTGIKNIGYYQFLTFNSGNDGDVTILKTPRTSVMIESMNYKSKTLKLEEIPTGIMQLLSEAVIHKEVYINKVKFVANSQAETEPIDFTNLYDFSVSMTKTGDVFNSEWSGQDQSGTTELVGLLKNNDKYIKLNN